jgi:serine/threonine-protein kinase RsbW
MMPKDAPAIVCLAVRCDQSAPETVRAALDEVPGLDSVRDDARLVASELVTNAVLHSKCAPDDLIEFRAQRGQDQLLISVHDPGDSDQTPELKPKADRAEGGLGLRIVQQLARRWGAECPDGHRVWAELAM